MGSCIKIQWTSTIKSLSTISKVRKKMIFWEALLNHPKKYSPSGLDSCSNKRRCSSRNRSKWRQARGIWKKKVCRLKIKSNKKNKTNMFPTTKMLCKRFLRWNRSKHPNSKNRKPKSNTKIIFQNTAYQVTTGKMRTRTSLLMRLILIYLVLI